MGNSSGRDDDDEADKPRLRFDQERGKYMTDAEYAAVQKHKLLLHNALKSERTIEIIVSRVCDHFNKAERIAVPEAFVNESDMTFHQDFFKAIDQVATQKLLYTHNSRAHDGCRCNEVGYQVMWLSKDQKEMHAAFPSDFKDNPTMWHQFITAIRKIKGDTVTYEVSI